MSLPRPGRLSDIKEKEGNVLEERLLGESNPATRSLLFNHLTRNTKKNAFLKYLVQNLVLIPKLHYPQK